MTDLDSTLGTTLSLVRNDRVVVLHVVESWGAGVRAAVLQFVASTPEVEHHLLRGVRRSEFSTDDESGFASVDDLLQIARHGRGDNVYLIRFHYLPPGAWDTPRPRSSPEARDTPDLRVRRTIGSRSRRDSGER